MLKNPQANKWIQTTCLTPPILHLLGRSACHAESRASCRPPCTQSTSAGALRGCTHRVKTPAENKKRRSEIQEIRNTLSQHKGGSVSENVDEMKERDREKRVKDMRDRERERERNPKKSKKGEN